MIYLVTFSSTFGVIELLWKNTDAGVKIIRVFLPGEHTLAKVSSYPPIETVSSKMIDHIITKMQNYLNGEAVVFNLDIIDLAFCPDFQQQVLQAEHGIPRGYVSTYGRIATRLGKPGGAQAVGRALATNPFPLIIPCHRAVASDGSLSGFQGGAKMKRALLEMEGIRFTPGGKVVMDKVYY